MLLFVGGIVASGVFFLLAPMALSARPWQVRRPRLALTLWWGSVVGGHICVGTAITAIIVVAVDVPHLSTPLDVLVVTVAPWLGLGALGVVIGMVWGTAGPVVAQHQDAVNEISPAPRSCEARGPFSLVRFSSTDPVAYAVAGPRPEIIISSALEEILSTAQLRAVLAHEYAHLRYRHNWLVRCAQVNAACLPACLPAGPRLRDATVLLVELIADDTAAKQAGAANLANALRRLSLLTGDVSLDLRAERMTLRTWPLSGHRRLPAPVRV
ncbi:M56 family metallopeptidase [Brevibacterium yomogidense]|uniref:M56 family metallopeptidase n=1 Tax=Brevibacterium yomogidense TaxID=946573 RepID=UPI0018E0648F|nr:M56 family metallopeptidase [Brevibacterium yomogidense]